ncbi:hypothetical protein Pelo_15997 [Pelomyxa schiedti]|nr:hypothetical protein Pelo_15997 [Pelomyxa schiedti]
MNNVFYYLRWFTKLNKVMTLAKQLHDDCLSGLQSHQPYFEQQIGLLYKALTSIRKPSQETVSLYDEISNKLYDMQHPRLPWDAADTKWLKEITAEVMELVGNSMELLPPSSDVSQHRSHKHTPQKTTISSDQTSITNVVEWMLSE